VLYSRCFSVGGCKRGPWAEPAFLRDGEALKHKYNVGETVYFTASNVARPAASGTYEVIRLLPTDGDDCQYRSRVRSKRSNGWPRKASSPFLKTVRNGEAKRLSVSPAVKRPVRRIRLRKTLSCESISIHFSPNVFYAALKDIAHELGLGQLARSDLAFAGLSDVADIGRGGIFRDHRPHHAVRAEKSWPTARLW